VCGVFRPLNRSVFKVLPSAAVLHQETAGDSLEFLFAQFHVTALGGLNEIIGGSDSRILLARIDLVVAHVVNSCIEATTTKTITPERYRVCDAPHHDSGIRVRRFATASVMVSERKC